LDSQQNGDWQRELGQTQAEAEVKSEGTDDSDADE